MYICLKEIIVQTIKLRINDKVYDRLIGLLSKFNREELEIIPEDAEFIKNQKYLAAELSEIKEGKATFVDIDEAEERLGKIISKNVNRL